MLFLTRKLNEVVYIQDNVTGSMVEVVVLDVSFSPRNGKPIVKLGFVDDKRQYTFLRKEVAMRQQHEEVIASGKTVAEISPIPNPYYKDLMPHKTNHEPTPNPTQRTSPA